MCYYFDNTFTDRDIYSVDVLLDEKMYKTSTGPKPMLIRFDKQIDLLLFLMVKLKIQYYLIMDCLIKFVIRLNFLEVKKWYYKYY